MRLLTKIMNVISDILGKPRCRYCWNSTLWTGYNKIEAYDGNTGFTVFTCDECYTESKKRLDKMSKIAWEARMPTWGFVPTREIESCDDPR